MTLGSYSIPPTWMWWKMDWETYLQCLCLHHLFITLFLLLLASLSAPSWRSRSPLWPVTVCSFSAGILYHIYVFTVKIVDFSYHDIMMNYIKYTVNKILICHWCTRSAFFTILLNHVGTNHTHTASVFLLANICIKINVIESKILQQ